MGASRTSGRTSRRFRWISLKAERLRLRGARLAEVLTAYAAAVDASMQSDSRLDAALALICAADFATGVGHLGLGREYRRRANQVYAAWGVRIETAAAAPVEAEELAEAQARADAAERADRAKSRLFSHVGH